MPGTNSFHARIKPSEGERYYYRHFTVEETKVQKRLRALAKAGNVLIFALEMIRNISLGIYELDCSWPGPSWSIWCLCANEKNVVPQGRCADGLTGDLQGSRLAGGGGGRKGDVSVEIHFSALGVRA